MNVLADLHRMPLKRSFEYAVAFLDEHGDIQDYDFADTFSEALRIETTHPKGYTDIELWVNVGNDERGLVNRDMYEIINGELQGDYPKYVAKHFAKTQ